MDVDGTILEPNRLSWEGCGLPASIIVARCWTFRGWTRSWADLVAQIKAASAPAAAGQTFFAPSLPFFVGDGSQRFLAMLAHELRNPLAPIRNAVRVLRRRRRRRRRAIGVRDAGASGRQMVRLVDDLLDVSRITRGKIELRKERVELAPVVTRPSKPSARSQSAGHELTVTLPPQPVYLDADPTRLAQVVGNLLNNACKFTDRGGRIWLTVERARRAGRHPGARTTASASPPTSCRAIFEMFAQVDTSLERSQRRAGHRPDAGEDAGRDARRHGGAAQRGAGTAASSWCACRGGRRARGLPRPVTAPTRASAVAS